MHISNNIWTEDIILRASLRLGKVHSFKPLACFLSCFFRNVGSTWGKKNVRNFCRYCFQLKKISAGKGETKKGLSFSANQDNFLSDEPEF